MSDVALWWAARSRREQILLGVLGAVALLAALLLLVVKPLQAARGEALADIRTYQTLAGRLRAAGPPVAGRPALRTGQPSAIVAATAAEAGLLPAATTPAGSGVTVTLADAPYDAVLRWVAATEATSALRLRTLSIDPGRGPGLVMVRAEFS